MNDYNICGFLNISVISVISCWQWTWPTHLVKDKPVSATATLDVTADLVEIFGPLEIPGIVTT